MLSLDKTKDIAALEEWLGEHRGVLSWKLDGLTILLEYQKGELVKAVTRGNGEVGEVITNNAKTFQNIPIQIPFLGRLLVRGEAVIRYSDFEKINEEIEEIDAKYKNPRNLCSGSVRQLNSEVTAKRRVRFIAFSLIKDGREEEGATVTEQLIWLDDMGFETVERKTITAEEITKAVAFFEEKIGKLDLPSDGLVLVLDDVEYGKSLGNTSKFPRNSLAFKWKDEKKETTLLQVEWSASRTGLINPVAIFEPVELEGTTVSRASLHNISIMEQLELGIADQITVYKANMIIPQIAENLTKSGLLLIPDTCPVCGGEAKIRSENEIKVLYCTNPDCEAKKIKSFTHFVSRDALNIEGLSEATIEKFIAKGIWKEPADLFHLEEWREEIINMDGFGERSYQNLWDSIQRAKTVTLPKFLYSLGILNIGLSTAKLICSCFQNDLAKLLQAKKEELLLIPGVGEVIADSFLSYFGAEKNKKIVQNLLKELTLEQETEEASTALEGKTFVITGSLEEFSSREDLKQWIEQQGGKVTGTVTSKTNYLINNEVSSSSSKNKKAKELGVPILSEKDLKALLKS